MTSVYKSYPIDKQEELLSNYLIDSWSYSKIQTFARNEKEFEMRYLYYIYGLKSASQVAGQAYHAALEAFFNKLKRDGDCLDVVELQNIAFSFINEIPANEWKIQKTTPSVEDCISQSFKDVSVLLNNFLSEIEVYTSEIKEILNVELYISEWITVNGVDIPMPCHLVLDMAIITNDDKRVIIDHKSKGSFSDEKEVGFTSGKQAITYTLGYESKTGEKIDEVWFVENKKSKNRDRSPQLKCFKIKMDKDTRRLYEAMLYEPLRRMIDAISNPDYVYLVNDSDNFVDKAELNEFWCQTMIAEIDDFAYVPAHKRDLLEKRLKKIRDTSLATVTPNIIKNFKTFTEQFIPYNLSSKDMTNNEKIEHVMRQFGIQSEIAHTFDGFSSRTYLMQVGAGVQIDKIKRYRLDIANALNVPNVRINKDLYIHNDKAYVAIESIKKQDKILAYDSSFVQGTKIPVGIDNFGTPIYWDINNQVCPNMLVCGAAGSGKSVFIISLIHFILDSGVNDITLFDPKFEFISEAFPKGVRVISDIEDIEEEMKNLVDEMNDRYKSGEKSHKIVIFDEFADAVANARSGRQLDIRETISDGMTKGRAPKFKTVVTGREKSLEENLQKLAQKGRAAGVRIVACTQRASAKIINGDSKANFSVQVCFRVPKEVDSMVVLDEPGAESLNGHGDGLIKSPEYLNTIRFQGFFKQ